MSKRARPYDDGSDEDSDRSRVRRAVIDLTVIDLTVDSSSDEKGAKLRVMVNQERLYFMARLFMDTDHEKVYQYLIKMMSGKEARDILYASHLNIGEATSSGRYNRWLMTRSYIKKLEELFKLHPSLFDRMVKDLKLCIVEDLLKKFHHPDQQEQRTPSSADIKSSSLRRNVYMFTVEDGLSDSGIHLGSKSSFNHPVSAKIHEMILGAPRTELNHMFGCHTLTTFYLTRMRTYRGESWIVKRGNISLFDYVRIVSYMCQGSYDSIFAGLGSTLYPDLINTVMLYLLGELWKNRILQSECPRIPTVLEEIVCT